MALTRDQALKAFLSGAEAKNPYLEADAAGISERNKNKADLESLLNPQLQDIVNQGGAASVGGTHVGADPYAHMMNANAKGDAAAAASAQKIYNQGLPKIQQVAQAASEGLDAVNDPKNIGSLGQARTLMLKSMGMNRYNENEAKAVLPPTLQGYVSNIFNAGGGDATPLNEVQRANINQFFRGQLDTASNQHSILKQNALNSAKSSPFYTQNTEARLQGLGSPMDSMFSQAKTKYQQVPGTPGPNLTAQPNPNVLDRLKSFLSMPNSPKQQQVQQAPSDPIADELAKRAKQSLNQPQGQQSPQGQ